MINLLEIFKNESRFTKKALGQHFLTNRHILDEIVTSSDAEKGANIIEIGPGCGVLTQLFAETGADITAVELDSELAEFLRRYLFFYPNLKIINDDALNVDFAEIAGARPVTFVGNLPYNVSVKIFERAAMSSSNIKSMVFMFQKEVADRISSKPCSKTYSSLSVFTSYLFDVKKVRDIGGGNFYPNANVMSSVLKFTPRKERELTSKEEELFFIFIRKCFTQKRKTLKNNLKDINNIDESILKADLKPSVRAEEVQLSDFIKLFRIINVDKTTA